MKCLICPPCFGPLSACDVYCTMSHPVRLMPVGHEETTKTRLSLCSKDLRCSLHGCFRKWWYPQIIHFNRDFPYKPSILRYPYFWKHPHGPIGWNKNIEEPTWLNSPCGFATSKIWLQNWVTAQNWKASFIFRLVLLLFGAPSEKVACCSFNKKQEQNIIQGWPKHRL